MKTNRGAILITGLFCLCALGSKSQTKWQEVRGFGGVSSYTSNTIYGLAEDNQYQILYASIGSEVYRWKGGNTSWAPIGVNSSLNADGVIYSVATDKTHNVYAAGSFTNSNGRCYVAKAVWNSYLFRIDGWTELGGLNGLNPSGPIYTVIADEVGNIYAAGSFLSTTGYRYVAKWNGTNWSEVGTGSNMLKANSYINTLCVDMVGNIYAAGDFTDSNGKQYVAKWDGTTWTELGFSTFSGYIKSITTDNAGNVYAAGQFSNGNSKFFVAKWNGTAWAELGAGGSALNANDYIYTITTDQNGNVYAAGDFTNASGEQYVAKWDGTLWTELGTAVPLNANSTIHSIVSDSKNWVFSAGDFTNHNGYKLVKNCTDISNGWAETGADNVGALNANYVTGIATSISGDTIYAANTDFKNVSRWDGKSWKVMGAIHAVYGISALTTDRFGNIYAAYKDDYVSIVIKWNGTTWVDVGNSEYILNARGGINKIITDSTGNLYVIGYFANAKNKYYVAKWNGTIWSELGTGVNALDADRSLSDITVDNSGNIYVCAYKYYNYHIAKWDGTSWKFLESDPYGNDISLEEISCIATDKAGNVYTDFTTWQGDFVRKWDGGKWTILSKMSPSILITNKDDDLFANNNGIIKRWAGNAWVDVGNDSLSKFRAYGVLYTDPKGNLLTVGSWNNSNPFAIAKYAAPSYSIQLCPSTASIALTSSTAGTLYQWQVNAGGGFINIADDLHYTGTKSNTVHLNNIPSSWYGYQFQCVADSLKSHIYTIKIGNSWKGAVSSAWENPLNWDCGAIPDANTDVVINSGTVVVNSNITVRSLKVNPGVNITVNSGYRFNVLH